VEVAQLNENCRQRDFAEWRNSFAELNDWLKAPEFLELEKRYQS
jgi:hypothetical protein